MAKELTVTVDIRNIEVFQQLCEVLIDMSKDERIPMHVREELIDRVNEILEDREAAVEDRRDKNG